MALVPQFKKCLLLKLPPVHLREKLFHYLGVGQLAGKDCLFIGGPCLLVPSSVFRLFRQHSLEDGVCGESRMICPVEIVDQILNKATGLFHQKLLEPGVRDAEISGDSVRISARKQLFRLLQEFILFFLNILPDAAQLQKRRSGGMIRGLMLLTEKAVQIADAAAC